MASLCRSHVIKQLQRMQFLKNARMYESLIKLPPAVCGTTSASLTCNQLEGRVQPLHLQHRYIHQSPALLKKHKFDPHMYEKVNVLDTDGHFVIECELLVLKEFCNKFSRFTYEQLKKEDIAAVAGKQHLNPSLQVHQLKEKHALEENPKHRKIIKMNMKELMDFKVEKVIQELFNNGSVTLQYQSVGLLEKYMYQSSALPVYSSGLLLVFKLLYIRKV